MLFKVIPRMGAFPETIALLSRNQRRNQRRIQRRNQVPLCVPLPQCLPQELLISSQANSSFQTLGDYRHHEPFLDRVDQNRVV